MPSSSTSPYWGVIIGDPGMTQGKQAMRTYCPLDWPPSPLPTALVQVPGPCKFAPPPPSRRPSDVSGPFCIVVVGARSRHQRWNGPSLMLVPTGHQRLASARELACLLAGYRMCSVAETDTTKGEECPRPSISSFFFSLLAPHYQCH